MAIIKFDFGFPGQPRKCYGDPLGLYGVYGHGNPCPHYLQEWPANCHWSTKDQTSNAGYGGEDGKCLVTWETHKGLCIQDKEMNGYNDSDFYMLVWNPEKQAPEEILYASTRGWTYPAMGSYVDATPEVMAAYNAYLANRAAKDKAARRKAQAKKLCELRKLETTIANTLSVPRLRVHKLYKGYGEKNFGVIANLITSKRIRNNWKLSIAAQVIAWLQDAAPKYPLPLSKRQSNALFGIY
jgi:hypothetical protein